MEEAGGGGTIHIDSVEAADLQSAIIAGKQQCIIDWSTGLIGAGTEAVTPWNRAFRLLARGEATVNWNWGRFV